MTHHLNRYFLIVLVSFCGFLISCGSDDDEEPTPSPIVGTWTYDSFEYGGTINGVEYMTYLTETYDLTPLEAQLLANIYFVQELEQELELLILTFNADGTFELAQGADVESGTYNLQNNNSQLTLVSGAETTVFDVEELTEHNLSLAYSEEAEEDLNDDGIAEIIVAEILINMMK